MMHLSKKKSWKKYGFKWMVLVLFESQLYISSVMSIEKKQKKDIVHVVLSSPFVVMSIEMSMKCVLKIKNKEKKTEKKNP